MSQTGDGGELSKGREGKGSRHEAGSCQRQNAAKMLSQRQRLILQLAKLSPLQLPSLCRSSPHFTPSSSLPCLPLPCKIIYCSANDAHRVGFVVFHNLRNQPVELPCQHPSSLSLAPSLLPSLAPSLPGCDVTLASAPLPAWCTFGSMLHASVRLS